MEGFHDEFLQWVGDRVRLHRGYDSEPDRRAETVLWAACALTAECGSAEDASEMLRQAAKYSRGVERTYWLALSGVLKEIARRQAREIPTAALR